MVLKCLGLTAAVVLASLAQVPESHAQSVSVSGIAPFMSAPYADDLAASRKGGIIAWSELRKGERSLWVAAAPEFHARRVVRFSGDDGLRLTSPTFSLDNKWLFFVRGGSRNMEGRNPNPASEAMPTEQAVWRVDLGGGAPERIGVGANPLVNPVTGDLYFKRDGVLFTLSRTDIAKGSVNARQVLSIRGGLSDLSWSPDGTTLLFSSPRGGHGFIGTWKPTESSVRWIAPEISRDMYPVWSPDGRKIAFLRVPGAGFDEYENFNANWRFSVWVHDLASGESRRLWESPNASGSQYEWMRTRPLLWASPTQLAFTSEHEGWLKPYALDVENSAVSAYFSGGCELWSAAADPARSLQVVSTNCGDLDRRHLWKRGVNGKLEPFTTGEGIESEPRILNGTSFVAYTRADARLPQGIYVRSLDGGQPRRVSEMPPVEFPASALIAPRSVTFASADSATEVHGQIFMPDTKRFKGRRPVIIFLHGGPVRQTVAGWYSIDYYDRFYAINQYLLEKGFAVLSVNYRAGVGYGRDYRIMPGIGPQGGAEYADILGAGRYLRSLPGIDGERVGIYGGSYGGYLAGMALARNSDLFKAGVLVHGVHDWAWHSRNFLYAKGAGWGIVGDERLRTAHQSSPAASLDMWRSPVLLVHGDDDENVLFDGSVALGRALRDRGVRVDALALPDEIHGILRYDSWSRIGEATASFFAKTLGADPK